MDYLRTSTTLDVTDRAPASRIMATAERIRQEPMIEYLLNAVTDPFLILNTYRQIVFANHAFLALVNAIDINMVLGLRPGEIMACIHANEANATGNGCSQSPACAHCGIHMALNTTDHYERPDTREAFISREDNSTFDLTIHTRPLHLDGEDYIVATMRDISDQKRRRALERVFFHEVMNTAHIIMMSSEMMLEPEADTGMLLMLQETLVRGSQRLIDEIDAQRDLLAAETNELTIQPSTFAVNDFMSDLVSAYLSRPNMSHREIIIEPHPDNPEITTDLRLLRRVVGNMLVNALEATLDHGMVLLVCNSLPDARLEFRVYNTGKMPDAAQHQVFMRFFSTKGKGRGLGTYGMKMFTERYLNGEVGFTTSEETGTCFYVAVPRE